MSAAPIFIRCRQLSRRLQRGDTLVTETDLTEPQGSSRLLKLLLQNGRIRGGFRREPYRREDARASRALCRQSKELASDYTHLSRGSSPSRSRSSRRSAPGSTRVTAWTVISSIMATAMKSDRDARDERIPVGADEFFSEELQDQMLLAALLDTEKKPELMGQLMRTWKSGDAERLHETTTRYLRDYPS